MFLVHLWWWGAPRSTLDALISLCRIPALWMAATALARFRDSLITSLQSGRHPWTSAQSMCMVAHPTMWFMRTTRLPMSLKTTCTSSTYTPVRAAWLRGCLLPWALPACILHHSLVCQVVAIWSTSSALHMHRQKKGLGHAYVSDMPGGSTWAAKRRTTFGWATRLIRDTSFLKLSRSCTCTTPCLLCAYMQG